MNYKIKQTHVPLQMWGTSNQIYYAIKWFQGHTYNSWWQSFFKCTNIEYCSFILNHFINAFYYQTKKEKEKLLGFPKK